MQTEPAPGTPEHGVLEGRTLQAVYARDELRRGPYGLMRFRPSAGPEYTAAELRIIADQLDRENARL